MGFSRKEHWSKSSFLFPGDLPDPGIEPASPAWLADSLPAEPPGKPHNEGGGSRGDQEGTVRGRKKQYCRSQSGPCLKKKKSAAAVEEEDALDSSFDPRASASAKKGARYDADGHRIYTMEELGINTNPLAGTTPLCPFDCDCCH